jgi:membrane fusion protein, multidrug efflux system
MADTLLRDTLAPPIPQTIRRRPRRVLKRAALAGAALLVVIGAGGYGYRWWTEGRFIETTDDAYVGGNVTTIAPHVAGFVSRILVADNEFVHAGQVLVELEPSDYRAAHDRAQAVLDQRNAALGNLEARLTLQQATIRQAAADLAAKAAQAEFAQQDARRYASLAQTAAGSRQDAQRSASGEQAARSGVLAAGAALDAARQQVAVLNTQIDEAKAAIGEARSELTTATLDLGYTEIRSPVDGFVGNRAAQVGAYVAAGTYLISVIPADGLWVDANFKEDQLAGMRRGQEADIVADIAPGHAFHGHLQSISPGTGAVFSVIPPENATGNFTKIVQRVAVRIALDADGAKLGVLRPGLSTTVSVDTRGKPDAAK